MKSNVKSLTGCKIEIELDIEAAEVMKELDKIVAQFTSRAKLPGFRPGKAPEGIIKQKFYPEIKESLINTLIPKALSAELKAQNLNPIATPVVNDLYFKEGEPLRFKAQFEVLPDFKLPDYKKVKIKEKKVSVTENEINQSLENLRHRFAEYVPVQDRGVVKEDYVAVELKGKDVQTKRHFPLEKGLIIAGHPENEVAINQNLLGMKPGEEKTFNIEHSKDHLNKRLAGKIIEYNLRVISIKEKKLPQLNDDFAKDFGEVKSLKDLKERIEEELLSSGQKAAKGEMVEDIINKISEKTNFELPEVLVEQESRSVLNRLLSSQPQQPLKQENLDRLKEESQQQAKRNLKNHFILKKIAETEKLTISDEEIQNEFKRIAKINNVPLAKVVESFEREGRREELKDSLLLKKAVDFLVEHAIIEK